MNWLRYWFDAIKSARESEHNKTTAPTSTLPF